MIHQQYQTFGKTLSAHFVIVSLLLVVWTVNLVWTTIYDSLTPWEFSCYLVITKLNVIKVKTRLEKGKQCEWTNCKQTQSLVTLQKTFDFWSSWLTTRSTHYYKLLLQSVIPSSLSQLSSSIKLLSDCVALWRQNIKLQRFGPSIGNMALPVMEFQVQGYKIRKMFA